MVKRLKVYTKFDKVNVSEGNGTFPARITFEDGSYYLNYLDKSGNIDPSKSPRQIYANGEKRVKHLDGVLIFGADRKWKKLAELL